MMKKILVMEDDAAIRSRIVDTLELDDDQYAVIVARNGREGVVLAKEEHPDLIISDIMMPELDGYGALQELRAYPPTALIPFVFLSAKSDRDHIREGMLSGADDYLSKPFSIDELLQMVRTQLAKREAQQRQARRELNDMRLRLANSLPHEFRTPLSSIIGFSELLRDYQHLEHQEIIMAAEQIRANAVRLQRLSENFLLYAQLEIFMNDNERLSEVRRASTVMAEDIIQRAIASKSAQYDRAGDVQVDCEPVTLDMPPHYVEKIIEELTDNALKFSPAGSIVSVQGRVHGKQYELIVQDAGRGMTAEQIANVGAYMQFDRGTFEQQGTGLGLILVKRLVELCGGEFAVTSGQGAGVTSWMLLPVVSHHL
jgi:signal transduction histidine kinase